MTMSTRRALTGAALVLVALGLGACSDSSKDPGSAKPAAQGSAASGSAGTAGAQSTVPPLGVIGTRQTSDGKTPLEVTLNEVKVDGQVMTVTWGARNVGTGSDSWQVASFFSDGIFAHRPDDTTVPLASEISGPADGVFVLDTTNAKRYLPARDAQGNCVCSLNGSGTFVKPGQMTLFQAVFKAPPADVSTVTVSIPHAGTFPGVALSR